MTSNEAWLPIAGYVGLYEVSDSGYVRSIDRSIIGANGHTQRRRGRVLRQYTDRNGRRSVTLSRDSRVISFFVHRLVLTTFIGPAPSGTVCCHKDGDSQNNHLSNLRWDTQSGNQFDSVLHGTHAEARKTHCVNGHEFSQGNTYFNPSRGGRTCRACVRAYVAAYQARKRLAAASA